MCIALFSTAHPEYALILLNNRDVCRSDSDGFEIMLFTPPYLISLFGKNKKKKNYQE